MPRKKKEEETQWKEMSAEEAVKALGLAESETKPKKTRAKNGNTTDDFLKYIPEEAPRKRGRPPKGDTRAKKGDVVKGVMTARQERAKREENTQILVNMSNEQKKATDIIAREFSTKLPEYVEKRKKEFEETLEKFKIENDVIIQARQGKVAHLRLSNLLSKPLIFSGIANTKLSASDIAMYSQCFWDCVASASEKILYVPTIEQFCGLMGMSVSSFLKYRDSQDENVREMVQMIYDKFCDYYTVKGLTQELNTIMAIFTLKARYGLRDNAPQTVVNNYNPIVSDAKIEELEKKFHFKDEDVIDVEV